MAAGLQLPILLRLYIGTENPPHNLIIFEIYIVRVFVLTLFNIKLNSSCVYGTKHVFILIQFSRYLDDAFKAVIDLTIQRDDFFVVQKRFYLR